MKVFAIGDLHLSHEVDKPMDVFGGGWEDHAEKIANNWREKINSEDMVLIPGDISWAMHLEDAIPDLRLLCELPGQKFFIRGNHDYWLDSPSKVREVLDSTTHLIRYNATVYKGVGICGVRGWPWPGYSEYEEAEDAKHWHRAKKRLELSLDDLEREDWDVGVAMVHYPPLNTERASAICDMLEEAGIEWVVYGHLHGEATESAFEGLRNGVMYSCVSADHIEFSPLTLFET